MNSGASCITAAGRKGQSFKQPRSASDGTVSGRRWNGIRPPSDDIELLGRRVRAREQLVIVSQDCDIVANVRDEPSIEALVCTTEKNRSYTESIDRNSARRFVVSLDAGLVAQARLRVSIVKEIASRFQLQPWPSDQRRLERCVRWLARRYDRPAVPDELDACFRRPVEDALKNIDAVDHSVMAAFNAVVEEIRVSIPTRLLSPYDVRLYFLVKSTSGLTRRQANAVDTICLAIRAALRPNEVELIEMRVRTEEEMSLAEYRVTRPLFLEYHTYRGDEVDGSPPLLRL